jgi:hypothetical protein
MPFCLLCTGGELGTDLVNAPSFTAAFSGAQLCVTYSPSSAATTHSSNPRKGHESIRTTDIYQHADLAMKQKALARTRPPTTKGRRYRPDDALLRFLESL